MQVKPDGKGRGFSHLPLGPELDASRTSEGRLSLIENRSFFANNRGSLWGTGPSFDRELPKKS